LVAAPTAAPAARRALRAAVWPSFVAQCSGVQPLESAPFTFVRPRSAPDAVHSRRVRRGTSPSRAAAMRRVRLPAPWRTTRTAAVQDRSVKVVVAPQHAVARAIQHRICLHGIAHICEQEQSWSTTRSIVGRTGPTRNKSARTPCLRSNIFT